MDNRRKYPSRDAGMSRGCRAMPRTTLEVAPEAELTHCQATPDCMVLAMAYVPMQRFESLYTPEVGFDRGTVFSRLDLPYLGTPLDCEEAACHA